MRSAPELRARAEERAAVRNRSERGIEPDAPPGVHRSVNIRALFFASYRDIAGAPELDLELPEGASGFDLVESLRTRGAAWQGLPRQPVIAVNQTYAPLETPLSEGDEVAFIPPVSGG